MAEKDWVSVGEYSNLQSAAVVAGRLSVEGVQHRVVSAEPGGPLFGALGEYSILVPPECVEAARRILSEQIAAAELAALALKDPPPDNFDPST
jgi:hypothetical protein